MPPARRRKLPRRRVALWVEEFRDKAMLPRGSDPEAWAAYDAWRHGATVAGLPPIGSPEGQELMKRRVRPNLRG